MISHTPFASARLVSMGSRFRGNDVSEKIDVELDILMKKARIVDDAGFC